MKKQHQIQIIKLKVGILRGEKTITEIEVRKPNVPALKGLKLIDLMQSDVNAVSTLLPRITQPTLTKADIDKLDIADFTKLTGAIFEAMELSEDENESGEAGKPD